MNAILNESRDDEFYNMVGMGMMRGKYCIENKKFWKTYTNEINQCIERNVYTMGLAEVNQATSYIPVLVDFDKKEELKGEINELYTMDTVMNVIRVYRQVLRDYVHNITDEHLKCVYLSKDPYVITKNGVQYLKHGFHLHFPYIFIQANQQQNIIHPKVSLLLEEHNNIDGCVYRVPWLLYGSVKEQGLKPYLIHSVFDFDDTVLDLDMAFSDYDLLNDEGKRYKHPERYLPRLLSTSSVNRERYCFNPITPYVPPVIEEVEEQEIEMTDEVSRLLPLIKQQYIEDTKKWKALIFTLCGLGVSNDTIHSICQRTTLDNYEGRNIELFINNVKSGRYGKNIKTITQLKRMCDMPKENQDLISMKKKEQEDELKIRYELLQSDHLIIATYFVDKYGMDYKVIDKNISFKWNNTSLLWEQYETENLPYDISIIRNDIDDIIAMLITSDLSTESANRAKLNLGNTAFLNNVWKQVYVKLLDKTFMDTVNKSPDELPITNGLKINLITGVITKRTKRDLFSVEVWALNKPDNLSKVDEYMNQLFHDNTEKIEYLHSLFGYWFTGNIEHRRMYFFTGVGRNGKSFLMNLFERIFRNTNLFCSSIMNTAIIKSESHHAKDAKPTPELEPFRRARFGVWNELQQGDKISTPLFKTLTGGDPLVHRPMYMRGEPIIFTSQTKGIVCTNILPEFDIADIACRDRAQVIDFPHRYKSPEELDENDKKHLLFLQSQEFLNMFFWWCIEGAQIYYRQGIPSPECLQVRKDEWIRNLDTTGQFIDTYTKDETGYVGCTEFFQMYIGWCKDNGHKHQNQTQIGLYMKANGYEKKQKSVNKKMKWVYIGLKQEDEDVDL